MKAASKWRQLVASRWASTAEGSERGAFTIWMLTIGTAAVILFGGLLFDGGEVLNMQSRVDDAAWSIARAAAIEVGVDPATGSRSLDPTAAFERAEQIAAQWPDLTWTMQVGETEVEVTVSGQYEPRLLSAVGFGTFEHTSTQTASQLSQ